MLNSGGFFFQNNIPPAGSLGPGALINGLHVDAGKGKLGGPLIEDTEIDTTGFVYDMIGATGNAFYIDNSAGARQIGLNDSFNDNYSFWLDEIDGLIYLGQYNGPFAPKPFLYIDINGSSFQIGLEQATKPSLISMDGNSGITTILANDLLHLDSNTLVELTGSGGNGLSATQQQTIIGDWSNVGNSTTLEADDLQRVVSIKTGNPGKKYFQVDLFNNAVVAGDIENVTNGFFSATNYSLEQFRVTNNVGDFLYIDVAIQYFSIGDSIGTLSGAYFELDGADKVSAIHFGGLSYFYLDAINYQYQLGDINATHNGNYFEVFDDANQFNFWHGATNWLQITASGIDTGGGVSWQFGNQSPGPVAFDTGNYLSVTVGGTAYKIALAV